MKWALAAVFAAIITFGLVQTVFLPQTRMEKEMVLRVPLSSDPKTLDPAAAVDTVSLSVVPSLFETLYQFSYLSDPYEVEPLLAAGFPKYSDNGLTLTIKIRKRIKFHDDKAFASDGGVGRELRAHDFIYGIKRLILPSIQSPASKGFHFIGI